MEKTHATGTALADLVMTTRSVTGSPAFVGRPMEAAFPTDGKVWLDLNTLGVHVPQLYGTREVESVTPELVERHQLCAGCLGYGMVAGFATCETCSGTGSARYSVRIVHTVNGGTELQPVRRA